MPPGPWLVTLPRGRIEVAEALVPCGPLPRFAAVLAKWRDLCPCGEDPLSQMLVVSAETLSRVYVLPGRRRHPRSSKDVT